MSESRWYEGSNGVRYEERGDQLIGHRPDGSTFVAAELVDAEVSVVEDEEGRRWVLEARMPDGTIFVPEGTPAEEPGEPT